MIRRLLLGLTLAATLVVAGCGGDPTDDYCSAIEEHRTVLSDTLSGEDAGATALFEALPQLEELQEAAPDDIRGDWNTLVGAVEGLQDALDDAGVAPSEYDPEKPPADLTGEDRAAIRAAATRLGSQATTQAAERIEQQSRDVCQAPLVL